MWTAPALGERLAGRAQGVAGRPLPAAAAGGGAEVAPRGGAWVQGWGCPEVMPHGPLQWWR